MHLAYVAVGSNLDDPLWQVKNGIECVAEQKGIALLAISSFYSSAAWGGVQQSDFVNAVIKIETAFSPLALLRKLKDVERNAGRSFAVQRWGPRILDLDILLFDQLELQSDALQIPHRHLVDRAFVVVPLLEIDEGIEIPGKGLLKQYLDTLKGDALGIKMINDA